MPVYGNNSLILSCKSDDQILAIAGIIPATLAQRLVFTFSGQKFTSRGNTALVTSNFTAGQKVWIDSIRMTIPGLSGVVNSNVTVATGGGSGSVFYVRPNDGASPLQTVNNIIGNTSALNEWIPINRLSPQVNFTNNAIYFEPVEFEADVDFRNADLTVYNGITIYAYLELQINCISRPT